MLGCQAQAPPGRSAPLLRLNPRPSQLRRASLLSLPAKAAAEQRAQQGWHRCWLLPAPWLALMVPLAAAAAAALVRLPDPPPCLRRLAAAAARETLGHPAPAGQAAVAPTVLPTQGENSC